MCLGLVSHLRFFPYSVESRPARTCLPTSIQSRRKNAKKKVGPRTTLEGDRSAERYLTSSVELSAGGSSAPDIGLGTSLEVGVGPGRLPLTQARRGIGLGSHATADYSAVAGMTMASATTSIDALLDPNTTTLQTVGGSDLLNAGVGACPASSAMYPPSSAPYGGALANAGASAGVLFTRSSAAYGDVVSSAGAGAGAGASASGSAIYLPPCAAYGGVLPVTRGAEAAFAEGRVPVAAAADRAPFGGAKDAVERSPERHSAGGEGGNVLPGRGDALMM